MTAEEAKKRFQSRKFGVFHHFLYGVTDLEMPAENDCYDWNQRVDQFDVERLARDLHEVGAGYYFITVMQGRKYMCAPNATFDRIAGTKPGEACAKRDLIWDLSEALKKYDIDLYLYFTGDGPHKDEEIGKKFGFIHPRRNISHSFVEKWAAVMEEYAVRYGERVKGWWIDGCFAKFGYNQDFFKIYHNAALKGNPSALITMNNGVREDVYRWYENEDFTAGEFNDFICIPGNTDVSPSIPHILAPLGKGEEYLRWAAPGCRRDAAYMKDYISKVNQAGGVVTIDVQIRFDSTFDPAQLECLAEIGSR